MAKSVGGQQRQIELGRLREVDPRQVWTHEALDLTPWLLQNADVLGDVLGIDIELTASEYPVGPFTVDLLGQDLTNDCVLIVENQLSPTDHDHLGKLVTYAAGTEAKTVVWLAPSFREEHRQALDFLNELGGDRARFFGIELTVVTIGDSIPAPLLRLRAQPNDWHAQVSLATRAAAQAGGKVDLYQAFWERFLRKLQKVYPGWTRARRPGGASWLSTPSPFKGWSYIGFCFGQNARIRVELYLDASDPNEVARLYAGLLVRREQIEEIYGSSLSWEELPNRRASRIADYAEGDILNTGEHDRYMQWFLDRN